MRYARDDDDTTDYYERPEPEDTRSEDFRCPGCEANTGNGRLCWRCRQEENFSDDGGEA